MNPETTVTNLEEVTVGDPRSPSWAAILAGAVAGLAAHLLLTMLGAAMGLGAAEPAADENPLATFGAGTAIVWTISALVSLWVGGWVAGRCAARVRTISGGMHGFLVWCVATIAALVMVASGAGMLVGGATRIAGQGLSALGKPLAGAADLAKAAGAENLSMLTSFTDEVAQSDRIKNGAAGAVAARREIGQAARKLFREGGNLRDPQARNALIQALTQSAGMNEAEAGQMVDRWTASVERMRADLEETKKAAAAKAREVADKASDALARAALWSFIGFILGAAAAFWGGRSGARWEYTHTKAASDADSHVIGRRTRLPGSA